MPESILTKAEEIINGQRAKDYGDARENHQRIADLWNVYLQMEPDESIAPEDVAVMMILLKIARFMENGYHHDTVIDIAGYAGVLEKMQLPKEQRYPEGAPTSNPYTLDGLQKIRKQSERRDLNFSIKVPQTFSGDVAPPVQRQWMELDDVPHGVEVVSRGGAHWNWSQNRNRWVWTPHGKPYDIHLYNIGPFTEVLKEYELDD